MELPDDPSLCAPLYPRLLQLNATDLVHGSYGIAEDAVVLTRRSSSRTSTSRSSWPLTKA
jgi:hypothetical protein